MRERGFELLCNVLPTDKSFARSQILRLRKNGNLEFWGHQKRSFSQNFFYKKIFFVIKLKH